MERAELLDGRLDGVQIRTASALLTVFDPETFTILDVRAVESLTRLVPDVIDMPVEHWDRHYWVYNQKCRALAEGLGAGLRSLDRALWQWSYESRPTRPR